MHMQKLLQKLYQLYSTNNKYMFKNIVNKPSQNGFVHLVYKKESKGEENTCIYNI